MIRFPSQIRIGQRPARVLALAALLLIQPTFIEAAPSPSASANQAKNLARMNCGAQIECITPDGRIAKVTRVIAENAEAAALIMDDDTVSCPLQEGETSFVIALAKTSLIDRFTFLNENAAARGQLRIAVSNYRLPVKSPKWTPVEGTIPFSNKRHFDLSLLGVEAKFVKLSFQVEHQGRIAALGLYGQQSLGDFAARQNHVMLVTNVARSHQIEDAVNFNFANLYARARVVYVSSGTMPAAQRMIDDDAYTSFQFSPTDAHPTAVVELMGRARLHRVSTVYKMQSGRIDIYLMDRMVTDESQLLNLTPIASITDNGTGKAAVDFDPRGARYVALRWSPDSEQGRASGFEIAEVSAFGDVPLSILNMDEAPQLYAANSKLPGPPDTLFPPIDPPILPVVSP
jgi:hypothetical protein